MEETPNYNATMGLKVPKDMGIQINPKEGINITWNEAEERRRQMKEQRSLVGWSRSEETNRLNIKELERWSKMVCKTQGRVDLWSMGRNLVLF